jgi:pimeloyl-ACP methyl ester carboxylesterase
VKQFSKNGIGPPLNWYRTRKVNYEDDLNMPADQKNGIKQPTLFIQALNDMVLTPDLAKLMGKVIPNLTTREVPAGHWALWQTAEQTNGYIKEWFEGVVFGDKTKL